MTLVDGMVESDVSILLVYKASNDNIVWRNQNRNVFLNVPTWGNKKNKIEKQQKWFFDNDMITKQKTLHGHIKLSKESTDELFTSLLLLSDRTIGEPPIWDLGLYENISKF